VEFTPGDLMTTLTKGSADRAQFGEFYREAVEHPRTVADRIIRFAERVGRENVVAGTDCGLRLRCRPQVAWAKLQALGEGAAIASKELWN
jgi:methionine synthase II (cobalamin-independent)